MDHIVRYDIKNGREKTFNNEYHDFIIHPEGFKSVYLYRQEKSEELDDKNFKQYFEQDKETVEELISNLTFFIGNGYPILPLLQQGEILILGWDIPIRYAIDADKQCWKDGAHGGALYKTEVKNLLDKFKDKNKRVMIEELLGIQPSYIKCPCCGSLVSPETK